MSIYLFLTIVVFRKELQSGSTIIILRAYLTHLSGESNTWDSATDWMIAVNVTTMIMCNKTRSNQFYHESETAKSYISEKCLTAKTIK